MILLTDYIDKEVLKNALIFFILIIGIISIIHFLLLLLHKIYIENKERKVKDLEKIYIDKILNIIYQGEKTNEIKISSSIEAEALSNVISSFVINLTGDLFYKVIEIAKNSGLIEYYFKRVKSRNWLTRLEALERLGYLKLNELKTLYLDLIKREKNYYVKLQILSNFSFIADEEILNLLIDELNELDPLSLKFAEHLFLNVINSFRSQNKEVNFIQTLEKTIFDEKISDGIKKSMIHACGLSQLYLCKDLLLKAFDSLNGDLKIACIRTLGRLAVPEVCDLIEKTYNSENWVLRNVSMQFSYLCKNATDILEKGLQDLNFYVRRSAALAFCKLGEKDKNKLLRFIETTKDKYAKEIALYVLKRICKYA